MCSASLWPGNHDWREADLLEAEALEKARTAEPCADDPPEFAHWLAALRLFASRVRRMMSAVISWLPSATCLTLNSGAP